MTSSPASTESAVPSNWNVPNALSTLRLILAIVVCGLIENQRYMAAMICFLIAASTDWIDGYWARKYNQITKLGRILDPFVDKIIICGAMIALVGEQNSGLNAWVATLVVGRELLITSIRGMIEGQGGDFSAKQLGKWKMVAQCAAIVAILLSLRSTNPAPWLLWTRFVLIYVAVLLTVLSAVEYLLVAYRITKKSKKS
jgi:CDP-diacylglycerol---glycerol-3-phosphate 3-phosphatidyltransferase